ncbi:hypothetical protein DFS34DRAFT_620774 [Phlyctochytrium arcticum]|nr:hypothetical protein DFS34DRAFT_620774 [Phlyctochytrium arcticum]
MSSLWSFSTGWGIPQTIQRRLLKFLLKRAIGQFLAYELDLENLDVELSKGTVVLKDLELNLEVLNDLAVDLPIVITDGRIGRIEATVPWKDMTSKSCVLELQGLHIEAAAYQDNADFGMSKSSHMSESQILSSSFHFAETFLRSEAQDETADESPSDGYGTNVDDDEGMSGNARMPNSSRTTAGTLYGLQALARIIDGILARVNLVVRDTTFHLSSPSLSADGNSFLDLQIPLIVCTSHDPPRDSDDSDIPTQPDPDDDFSVLSKDIKFRGLTLSLRHRSSLGDFSGRPTGITFLAMSPEIDSVANIVTRGPVASTSDPSTENFPQVDVDVLIEPICIPLTPETVATLSRAVQDFSDSMELLNQSKLYDPIGEGFLNIGSHVTKRDGTETSFSPPNSAGVAECPQSPSAHPVDVQPHKGLNFNVVCKRIDIFLNYLEHHEHWVEEAFLETYFGNRTVVTDQKASSGGLSTTILTQQNTKVNAGGATLDNNIGAALGDNHLLLAFIGLTVSGHSETDSSGGDRDWEVNVSEIRGKEWYQCRDSMQAHIPKRRSRRRYEGFIFFGRDDQRPEIISYYDQLKSPHPPSGTKIYLPGRATDSLEDASGPLPALKIRQGPHNKARKASKEMNDRPESLQIHVAPLALCVDPDQLGRIAVFLNQIRISTSESVDHPSDVRKSTQRRASSDFIMDDLQKNQFSQPGNLSVSKAICVRVPFLRVWCVVPSTTEPPEHEKEECNFLLFDLINVNMETIRNASEASSWTKTTEAGRHHSVCTSSGRHGFQQWTLECELAGLSLAHDYSSKEVIIKPFMSFTTPMQETSTGAGKLPSASCPNIELTIRDHVCDALLERPTAEVHATPTGLAFNRADEGPQETFGMQSWYDVGSSEGSPKSGTRSRVEPEEDLLWFQQRSIQESLVHVNCSFPSCFINICKTDFDDLQFWINGMTRYQAIFAEASHSAQERLSEEFLLRYQMNPNLRSPASPHQSIPWNQTGSGTHARKATAFSALATCLGGRVTIHLDTSVTAEEQDFTRRSYTGSMEDLRIFLINGQEDKERSYLWVDVDDISYSSLHQSLGTPATLFAYRTASKQSGSQQMLSFSTLSIYDDEINMKETTASVNLSNFTLRYIPGFPLISDVSLFLKEPPALVLLDMTTRFTKLHVNLSDVSVDYQPLYMSVRSVLLLGRVQISCNIIPDSPTISVKIILYNSLALIADDTSGPSNLHTPATATEGGLNAREFWLKKGFVVVGRSDHLDLSVRTNSGDILPYLDIDLTNNQLNIDVCADSYQSLIELVTYIANAGDLQTNGAATTPAQVHRQYASTFEDERVTEDLLDALDDDNFKPRVSSDLDEELEMEDLDEISHSLLIELDEQDAISPQTSDEFDFGGLENERENSPTPNLEQPPNSTEAGVLRIFEDPATFNIVDDYFLRFAPDLPESNLGSDRSGMPEMESQLRVRVRDFDLFCNLFDGYDLPYTRQKIVERASAASKTHYKGAVSGLEVRQDSLKISTGISAADREWNSKDENIGFEIGNYFLPTLQQHGGEERQYSEFDQDDVASVRSSMSATSGMTKDSTSVPAQSATSNRLISAHELVRSESSQIILKCYSMSIEFDSYSEDAQTAWQLRWIIKDVEIIDNVRSSRWRKFLTILRPDGDAVPRETSSSMVKIDVCSVRPTSSSLGDEELRLKVAMLPLRMHVDQDALGCMLRFFAFENPKQTSTVKEAKIDTTFFQLCSILPISVKIDYKPKHVDYANLKGGNLIEIMNFFQLEGADMTLRAIRITGVRGWERLFEGILSQWLPHIRSTQVPRVVSGVSGVRSLVNLGSGLADLVLLPLEQYKKDGKLVRGLQRGARSFVKAATSETIKLGTKLAVGTQSLLEQADVILSKDEARSTGATGAHSSASTSMDQLSKFSEQPKDMREGVNLAYQSLSRNVATAARTVLAVPLYDHTSTGDTVNAVIRAMPVAILKPMIGASEAVSKALMGLQNTMDPNKRLQMEDKYKG